MRSREAGPGLCAGLGSAALVLNAKFREGRTGLVSFTTAPAAREAGPVCVRESSVQDWRPCAEPRGREPRPAPSAPRAGGGGTRVQSMRVCSAPLPRDWPVASS